MPHSHYSQIFDSPIGALGIGVNNGHLVRLDYLGEEIPQVQPAGNDRKLSDKICNQLDAYFSGNLTCFDIPILLKGTTHQRKLWRGLQKITYGKTLPYASLAHEIGSSARAVGQGCRRNPVSIIIPCHRVVASCGIGGYGGQTSGAVLDRKIWLLRHEGSLNA